MCVTSIRCRLYPHPIPQIISNINGCFLHSRDSTLGYHYEKRREAA